MVAYPRSESSLNPFAAAPGFDIILHHLAIFLAHIV